MVRKTATPEFPAYEPGEPEDVKTKAAKEAEKKERSDRRWTNFWDIMNTVKWIALAIIVVVAIIFGLNRFVHWMNEDARNRQALVASCMLDGNTFGYFNGDAVCFQGVIVAAINSDQKKDCIAQGNYPINVSASDNTMYMCMKGKIVAVR